MPPPLAPPPPVESIVDLIGLTPMVRIRKLCPNPRVRIFAKLEGFSPTGGAALWAARQVAQEIEEGTIVTIFPDRGDKYLSTALFQV